LTIALEILDSIPLELLVFKLTCNKVVFFESDSALKVIMTQRFIFLSSMYQQCTFQEAVAFRDYYASTSKIHNEFYEAPKNLKLFKDRFQFNISFIQKFIENNFKEFSFSGASMLKYPINMVR
jgi:hypothetical protein